MILLLRQEQRETTDGDLHNAVWQPTGFCISLFRPHCHSRPYSTTDTAGEHHPLLPRSSSVRRNHQRSALPTDQRIQPLGRSFRPETRIPVEWAEKGVRKED